MKKLFCSVAVFLSFIACTKEEEVLQSGIYFAEFSTKNSTTPNTDPNIKIERVSVDSIRIDDFLTVYQKGSRLKADIHCCFIGYYSAYELLVDGTFRTKKGVSSIEGTFTAIGQAGPFGGVFRMKKIQ